MCFSKGGILWRFVIKICLIKRSTEVIRTQWQNFLQDPRTHNMYSWENKNISTFLCKVSPRPLLYIHTVCSIQWFWLRTVKALNGPHRCAGWSGPSLATYVQRHVFAWHCPSYLELWWKVILTDNDIQGSRVAETDQLSLVWDDNRTLWLSLWTCRESHVLKYQKYWTSWYVGGLILLKKKRRGT